MSESHLPGSRTAAEITITGGQRDALYQVLITQLSTFDDLSLSYERRELDVETSATLDRLVADGIRLIIDGGVGRRP